MCKIDPDAPQWRRGRQVWRYDRMRLIWMATEIGGAPAEVGYIVARSLFDEPEDPPRCDIQRVLIGQLGFLAEIDVGALSLDTLDELAGQCSRHQAELDAEEAEQREFLNEHSGPL